MIRVGEVCAGIGGIGRGLEATGGFQIVWHSEIEPYPCLLLDKHPRFRGSSPGPAARVYRYLVPPGIPLLARDVPNRVARLKALGNCVVPQVAEHVGRCILQFDAGN